MVLKATDSMLQVDSDININLSAIAYKETGSWIAHCLELDVVAEGDSMTDALESLISLCDFQIKTALEEGDLQSIFRAAPPEVWKMFSSARMVTEKKQAHRKNDFESPVNRFEARFLSFA